MQDVSVIYHKPAPPCKNGDIDPETQQPTHKTPGTLQARAAAARSYSRMMVKVLLYGYCTGVASSRLGTTAVV